MKIYSQPQKCNKMENVNTLEPDTILKHIEAVCRQPEAPLHTKILSKLLEQVAVLDFETLVYPETAKIKQQLEKLPSDSEQVEELKKRLNKFKLKEKHLQILSIENVLSLAEKNRWGMCKNNDFVYLYNGTYWNEIESETLSKFLGEAAEKMGVGKFSARYFQFREQLLKQFLSMAYLPTPENDKNNVLINLKNGTFVITPTGTNLKPFDSADFLTYQLPFDYNPEATAPIFQAYLDRVLPDVERQNILSEYLGYVFIKHGSNTLKEEQALILYGSGANGKSVFFEVVNALLGTENISSYSLQSLTNENGYYRAKIANKLVNYASEINSKLEAATFKQLVSGEPVEARLPYGQPFTLKQYAKLIFNCNELPKDVEHTKAYFRRFLIIPFDVSIPEPEQDKRLHIKIIESELSGVFNWVLEGLNRLLQQKRFSDCEAAREALEQYKTDSNSVKQFLEEYEADPIRHTLIKELYRAYLEFCYADRNTPFKRVNFSKQLEALGIRTGRQSGTGQNIAYVVKKEIF